MTTTTLIRYAWIHVILCFTTTQLMDLEKKIILFHSNLYLIDLLFVSFEKWGTALLEEGAPIKKFFVVPQCLKNSKKKKEAERFERK